MEPPSEDDRASTVDDHTIIEMQCHGACQHHALDIAADSLELACALAVVDAHDVLVDDRPVVELLGHVVGGRAYQLHAALAGAAIRIGAGEGGQKGVVNVDRRCRQALEEPLSQIIDAVKETLDRTPPELASDIMDRGIMLAGGGSLLQGLDERLREETQMPAHLAESPLTCVAVGSGRSLEEFEAIHRSNRTSRNRRRR